MHYRLLTALFVVITICVSKAQFVSFPTNFDSPVTNIFEWHNKLWVSTAINGLYVSEDNGDTWIKKWKLHYQGNVSPLENNGLIMVNQIVTYQNFLFGCTNHGLYRSTDEGINWQLVKNFVDTNSSPNFSVDVSVLQLVLSPHKFIALLSDGRTATSTDEGNTWSEPFVITEAANDSPNQRPRQFISWANNKWYLLTAKRLLVSTNDAQTWEPLSLSVGNSTATALCVNSNDIAVGTSEDWYDRIGSYIGKKVSLYTSKDGGHSWTQTEFSYNEYGGIHMPVDINITYTAGHFYASAKGDVWKTTAASSWTNCREGIKPRVIYGSDVSVQANLMITDGRIYTIVVDPSPVSQYIFYYKLYSRPLAELEATYFAAPALPVVTEWTSFTNVISWQDVSDGEESFEIERSEQSSTSFQLISSVAAGITTFQDGQVRAGISYYYRIRAKKGGGYSAYSPIAKSLRSNDCVQVNNIGDDIGIIRRVEQPTPLILYALSGTELIKSINGGRQWQTLDVCDADNALYADISFPSANLGFVISRGRPNIFKTEDGGLTWKRLFPKIDDINLESFSVHFVNDSVGYMLAKPSAFGSYYTLYKTTNGGYSFDKLSNSPQFLLDDNGWYLQQKVKPCFIGSSTIVGFTALVNNDYSIRDRIAISTDGGITWHKHLIPTGVAGITRLHAISADDIWIFGQLNQNTDVYHTTNGGVTWTKIDLPDRLPNQYEPINVYDIRFADAQRGIVIGGKAGRYDDSGGAKPATGYIYKTSDGGLSWTLLNTSTPIEIQLKKLSIQGQQVVIFGAGVDYNYPGRTDRLTLTSTDLGANWERSCDLTYIIPRSIAFRTDKESYMVGPAQVFIQGYYSIYTSFTLVSYYHKSTDGGLSWKKVLLPETERLFEVYFLNSLTGFLTTQDAVWVTSDGGQSWQRKLTPAPFLPERVYYPINFAEKFQRSYFIDDLNWLRISNTNQVFKTSDGGNTWIQVAAPTFTNTPIFSFVDTQVGFCTGEEGKYNGQIYQTVDGGLTWKLVGQGARGGLPVISMYFTDANTGFMNDRRLKVTHDGGRSWNTFEPILNDEDQSYGSKFTFFNKDIGYWGGLYKTIDGGKSWNKMPKRSRTVWPLATIDEHTAYALNTSIRHGSTPCNLVPLSSDTIICKGANQPAALQLATGVASSPLSYQWYKHPEKTLLPGQTSATLSLTGLSTRDIKSFYCVATNGCGTAISPVLTISGEQVEYSIKDGDWSDPAIWSCKRLPTGNDRVLLKHSIALPETYKGYAHFLDFFDSKAKLRYNSQSKLLFNSQ
ncbi:hypothetical protein GCM10028807_09080 [Spirosoma daeguense]